MSLYWMDGFDGQDMSRWTVVGTATVVAGRVGGYAIKTTQSGSDTYTRNLTGSTSVSCGFAVKSVVNASNGWTGKLVGGGTNAVYITGNTGGWNITYNSNTGAVSYPLGTSVVVGNWEHFEVLYVSHASTGRVQVKQNGVVIYDFTGNTSSYGSPISVNSFVVAGGYLTEYAIDDIWVSTGELYGDCRVRGLFPTADVTKGWTPSTGTDHYALVDEVPPSMTDYVSAVAASGLSDTFTLTVPGDIATVKAVQVNVYGLKTDAGVANLRLLADGQESADLGLATTAGGVSALFPTGAAAAAWTPAKLAAAGAVGIKAP